MSNSGSDLFQRIEERYSIRHALWDIYQISLPARGGNTLVKCPFHDDKNPSLSVNPDKNVYNCLSTSCGKSGGLISLIQDAHGCSRQEAFAFAAEKAGLDPAERSAAGRGPSAAPRRPAARDKIDDLSPWTPPKVPADAPEIVPGEPRTYVTHLSKNPGETKTYRPDRVHTYRDADGARLFKVLRMQRSDGGKYFMPLSWRPCDTERERVSGEVGGSSWQVAARPSDTFLPPYGLEDVRAWARGESRTMIVVEGEKTRDSLNDFFRSRGKEGRPLVLAPCGSGGGAYKFDWTAVIDAAGEAFSDTRLYVWPDADPMTANMREKGVENPQDKWRRLLVQGLFREVARRGWNPDGMRFHQIVPPGDVESGWDADDAICGGWDVRDMRRFFMDRSYQFTCRSWKEPIHDKGVAIFDDPAETEAESLKAASPSP